MELNTEIASAVLNIQELNMAWKKYKCFYCSNNYHKNFNENLNAQLFNTYKFANHDIIKLISLLQKSVYPYEHMTDWEKFNKTLLGKEDFYSNLNIKDIADWDHAHVKRVCKDFK